MSLCPPPPQLSTSCYEINNQDPYQEVRPPDLKFLRPLILDSVLITLGVVGGTRLHWLAHALRGSSS